ncbi:hypothetical protein B0H11DRAFT_1926484 [Mycena galericulata]|nr:hypothetical protein B0H11DRAFT_1926484 [Mycena galericulata]
MPALRTRDTHPSAARSLEVSTGAPPPSLTIISPTPRAFTFPIAHNLADSPYSSPSNSPFEPDLRALALSAPSTPSSSIDSHHPHDECRSPPPLSAFTRTLSPAAAAAEPSPASTSSAPPRRKSTSSAAGEPEERRPKKGDEDYVKRPENAFILFRRKCCEDRALGLASTSTSTSAPSSLASGPSSADSPALAGNNGKKQRQADLSKTISQQWKALAPEERAHWEALAKEKKREHETLHPNYVYRPQRSGAKNRSAAAASPSMTTTTGARRKNSAPPQQVEFVVPAPRGAQHGRSASAPTPPPYQAIQIPNVYFGNGNGNAPLGAEGGDSPTSLMPMISRRGVGNGQGGFDYLPSNSGFASFDFEASLQSSDFLRAMFPPSSTGGSIMSPASSASGSGPSSPYTPASASFHPSAFSSPSPLPASYIPHPSSASHSSFAQSLETASYAAHDDLSPFGAGLGLGLGLGLEPAAPISHPASYASYASAWAASSPWAAAGPASAMAEGDFDIGRIPEIGWEMGGCASSSSSSFGYHEGLGQGGDAYEGHGHAEGGYEGAEGDGADDGADADDGMGMGMGMDFGELDLGAGMEMGFDEMMAGSGF